MGLRVSVRAVVRSIGICVALTILVAACGNEIEAAEDRALQAIQQGDVPSRALVAGNPYFSTDRDGNRTEGVWVEGMVVNMNGQFQVVQPEGYSGPPVMVDDAFKATMTPCEIPAGSTWIGSDGETGTWEDGDLIAAGPGDTCVVRGPETSSGEQAPVETPATAEEGSATVAPAVTAVPEQPAEPEPAEPVEPAEPEVAAAPLGSLEALRHETTVSTIEVNLPSPYEQDEERFAELNYSIFSYSFVAPDQLVRFAVTDNNGFFSDREEQEFEDNISAKSQRGAESTVERLDLFRDVPGLASLGTGRDVSASLGLDGQLAGYELDVEIDGRNGHLAYFRKDGVRYTLLGVGLTEQDWQQILASVVVTPMEELTG